MSRRDLQRMLSVMCPGLLLLLLSCEEIALMTRIELPQAKYIGVKDCTQCHKYAEVSLKRTAHWVEKDPLTPLAKHGCESCHGPGSVHVDDRLKDKAATDIVAFGEAKAIPSFQQDELCMECHKRHFREWSNSPHSSSYLGCASCHFTCQKHLQENHAPKLLKWEDPQQLCGSCHQDVMAEFKLISKHPVGEGRMSCSDCHDVHGAPTREKSAQQINQNCVKCHTDQQGPFVFEHAAIRDGCITCHRPHGSTVRRLLTEPDYNLCLKCHYQAATYQALGHYSHRRATNQPILGPQHANCVVCHRAIHGSNFSKEFRTH